MNKDIKPREQGMMNDAPETVTLVPIERIEILNSRDRNMRVFEEIVENIRAIGLKKPITVTERSGADGEPAYLLVCGEGRPQCLSAFSRRNTHSGSRRRRRHRRGRLHHVAGREHCSTWPTARWRSWPISSFYSLSECTIDDIIQRTGLSQKYVRDIVFLLEKGEERLIGAVQNGTIPLTTALEIARAKHDDGDLGDMLEEAYKNRSAQGPPDRRGQTVDRAPSGKRSEDRR